MSSISSAIAGRRRARPLLVAAVSLVFLALTVSPASAHAQLESSHPAAGSVLAEPPNQIRLTFDDPIDRDGSTVHVFDDRGGQLETGAVTVTSADAREISVDLGSPLVAGTYTVEWVVTSEDTHPVTGSFIFSVVAPSPVVDVPVLARNDLAGFLLGVMRWASYVGLVLGPGVILVLLLVWPAALRHRRPRLLVGAGLALLSVSTIGGMFFQGVWASGASFGDLLSSPQTVDTHSRKFDAVYAWRAYLVVAFSAAVVLAMSRSSRLPERSRRAVLGAVSVSTLALAVTWPLVSHSAVDPLPVAAGLANLLHSLAMAVWLGGLVVIFVCLREVTDDEALSVLRSFSRVAVVAVGVLGLSGVLMALREMHGLEGLVTTEFGRVLLAKVSMVAVLLAVGDVSRRWVRRRVSAGRAAAASDDAGVGRGEGIGISTVLVAVDTDQSLRGLRTTVAIELLLAAAVLAVTAALVVIGPGQ